MSYCRWSSDDYQCDVYVYESANGWEIHVASGRYVFKGPLPPPVAFSQETLPAFVERSQKVTAMCDDANVVAIDLPSAGESFTRGSPGECADCLEHLLDLGYRVPLHVIETLREEQQDSA